MKLWVQKKINGKEKGHKIPIQITNDKEVYYIIQTAMPLLTNKKIAFADVCVKVDDVEKDNTETITSAGLTDGMTIYICWDETGKSTHPYRRTVIVSKYHTIFNKNLIAILNMLCNFWTYGHQVHHVVWSSGSSSSVVIRFIM